MAQAPQFSIQSSAVREQLNRILEDELFTRSARMGRFLRLAVERMLEGKADELKEYLIGVEVFDRKADYDPRVDPIVRVEARRLRAKLKSYYDGTGRSDQILIEFVSGSYAPRIRTRASIASPVPEPPAVSEPGLTTLAVLPLANLSPVPGHEYFSDGMTEELIHALTKAPGMRVVAWNTASQLSGRQQDIRSIGEQLSIDTVLTGSVRIAGANLRVRAQLIDTRSGVYLWSETFDRQMSDVFEIQEEIAHAIVRTLRVQLSASPGGRGRSNLSSYDWYLRGRHFWRRRTAEDLQRSLECFECAIAADPRSALAHVGLADAYTLLVDYGPLSPDEGMSKAKAAASRAIELDPEIGEACTSLAIVKGLYEWEWEEAEALYKRSIALNPGYATAHHWLANDHYANLGRFDEALAEVEIALELDPLSSILYDGQAYVWMVSHQYDEALAKYQKLIERDPTFSRAYASMGRVFALMGRHREAIAVLERAMALAGPVLSIIAALGQVHAEAGDAARAHAALAELERHAERMAERMYVPGARFAIVHMGLGDHERALDYLEKGCDRREPAVAALGVHPLYDPLRGEPRFQALLKRLHLA